MRKLSVSLKESRFVDLINKKFTGEIRKEDKIGNLKELKPVDIETSHLFCGQMLTYVMVITTYSHLMK